MDHQEDTLPLLQQPLQKRQGRPMKGDEIRDKYRLPERNNRYSKMNAHHTGTSAVSASSSPQPDVRLSSHNRGGGGLQVNVCVCVCMYMGCRLCQKYTRINSLCIYATLILNSHSTWVIYLNFYRTLTFAMHN